MRLRRPQLLLRLAGRCCQGGLTRQRLHDGMPQIESVVCREPPRAARALPSPALLEAAVPRWLPADSRLRAAPSGIPAAERRHVGAAAIGRRDLRSRDDCHSAWCRSAGGEDCGEAGGAVTALLAWGLAVPSLKMAGRVPSSEQGLPRHLGPTHLTYASNN